MNDVAKHLAINFRTQRERDQYIIDNATYFKCVYKTHRSLVASEKFNDVNQARYAAEFTSQLMRKYNKKDTSTIRVVAYIEDSKGNAFDALVETIKQPSVEVLNGEEKRT